MEPVHRCHESLSIRVVAYVQFWECTFYFVNFPKSIKYISAKCWEKKILFNILDAVVQNLLHRAWYCFSVSKLLSGCCFILSESKYFWYWMSRLSVSSLYRRLLVSNFSGRFWWYFWMLYKRFQQNVSILTNKQKNARKQHAAYSHTLHGNVPPLILEIMIPSGLSTLILTTTG